MAIDITVIIPLVSGILLITLTYIVTKKFINNQDSKITLLDKEKKYPLKLIEKIIINHDTRIFRFGLPSPKHVLGLPTGQHVFLSANINDSLVIRPYTPVSGDGDEADKGHMDLLVKVYFKGVNSRFPEGGKMSQYLEQMEINSSIDVRGPNGLLIYDKEGIFKIKVDKKSEEKIKKYSKLCMIAGGTGITPMYQMIKDILRNKNDKTEMFLLFANQTEADILLRNELEDLSIEYKGRFHVWFTIDRSIEKDWKYSVGFVNMEMIKNFFPAPSDEVLVSMCGPPPMIQFACNPALDKLTYPSSQKFIF